MPNGQLSRNGGASGSSVQTGRSKALWGLPASVLAGWTGELVLGVGAISV